MILRFIEKNYIQKTFGNLKEDLMSTDNELNILGNFAINKPLYFTEIQFIVDTEKKKLLDGSITLLPQGFYKIVGNKLESDYIYEHYAYNVVTDQYFYFIDPEHSKKFLICRWNEELPPLPQSTFEKFFGIKPKKQIPSTTYKSKYKDSIHKLIENVSYIIPYNNVINIIDAPQDFKVRKLEDFNLSIKEIITDSKGIVLKE